MARQCHVTREEFAADAPTIEVVIDGNKFAVQPKDVVDGKSLGWFLNAKATVKIGDKYTDVQIGLNVTCIGSKHL